MAPHSRTFASSNPVLMLAEKFNAFTALRPWLHTLAWQLLGSRADADDMVQECFLRWQRARFESVRNPKAFLTTVMTRLCLKHLQSARVRHERPCAEVREIDLPQSTLDPSDYADLAESLSLAVFVMLETLAPIERAVFLLREVFDCDYDEIGVILGKRPENCRQILSRARDRVAGRRSRFAVTPARQEEALQSFLRACASGNWQEVLSVLAEDAELTCDGADLGSESPPQVNGLASIIALLQERAARWIPPGAKFGTVWFRGLPVAVASVDDRPVVGILAEFTGAHAVRLRVVTCPVRLRALTLEARLKAARITDDPEATMQIVE